MRAISGLRTSGAVMGSASWRWARSDIVSFLLWVAGSAAGDQPAEHRAVLEAVAVGHLGGVLLHALADRLPGRHVEAGHLALVAYQRGDLLVDAVADVHDDVGHVHPPVPELADLVRLQPV